MKNLLLPILLFSFLFAEGNKVNLKIDGMKCAYSCAGKVSEVVQNIKGVEECKVDFASGTAEVVYDCLLYTSPSPRDRTRSRMPSSA